MKKPAAKKTPVKKNKASPKVADRRPPPPPRSAGRIDPALIEQIGDIANRLGLSEIEVQHDDLRIRVARQVAYQTVAAAPVAHAPTAVIAPPPVAVSSAPSNTTPAIVDTEHPGAVKSPMVGTAYRRPSPNDKTFVDIGTIVKAGEKILLVEAMKTFNEIVAPRSGTITQIMVEDGQPVEYGQVLVIIE